MRRHRLPGPGHAVSLRVCEDETGPYAVARAGQQTLSFQEGPDHLWVGDGGRWLPISGDGARWLIARRRGRSNIPHPEDAGVGYSPGVLCAPHHAHPDVQDGLLAQQRIDIPADLDACFWLAVDAFLGRKDVLGMLVTRYGDVDALAPKRTHSPDLTTALARPRVHPPAP